MYDTRNLKPTIAVTARSVECPVAGCQNFVERQRRYFRQAPEFYCETHRIYISASTHEYVNGDDNLLSRDTETLELFKTLTREKRESARLGRERSEDALTFNVFRALQQSGVVDAILSQATSSQVTGSVISYWAIDSVKGTPHPLLASARATFGEKPDRGTEPDLLIECANMLILVEAKLGSSNNTTPTHAGSLKAYSNREGCWYSQVFVSDAETVAIRDQRYQLMRLWLLGTWMGAQTGKRFSLISLGSAAVDSDLVDRFGAHLVQSDARRFVRYTWDAIRDHARTRGNEPVLLRLAEYLAHKTLGYDAHGRLLTALPSGDMDSPSQRKQPLSAANTQLAIQSLHALRNRLTQTRRLQVHCEWITDNFRELVTATREAVHVRAERGYRTGTLPEGARMPSDTVRGLQNERALEQELFATFGPSTGSPRLPVLGRVVAYQVPLFDARARQGWGHIDLVGLEDDGTPVVIELKRHNSPESPLRCLLEVVANAIAVQENWTWMGSELATLDAIAPSGIGVPERLPTVPVVILAPSAYWQAWEPMTSRGKAIGAAGYEAFRVLCSTIAKAGFPVRFGGLALPVSDECSIADAVTAFR